MPDTQQSPSIRDTVVADMVRIGQQQGKTMPPLTDDTLLLETGLDSLCFAILVATLDDRLGLDPFDGDGPTTFPATVGALIAAYEVTARRN